LLGLGGFQLQVGIDALVIALLAVGLNIVVGWAGLLDLGYVAFFGFGAYGFALLSSSQIGPNGIHLPTYLSVPIVMIGAAILALAGTVFAAQQLSVFPTDFDTPILILIYAGLILGGAGIIAGAAAGALVVMVIYDGLLRSPTDSGYLFYGLILLTLVVRL